MATPPDWPVGYPALVIQNVNAVHGFIAVASGTNCKIVSAKIVRGQSIACIELPSEGNNSGKLGWVPKSALQIGQTRKVGNIGFNIGRPGGSVFP